MFGKKSSSAYGNAPIKSSGLSSRLPSSKRVSSELAFALDKQRLAYRFPKIAAALPDHLNPSVVHNLQIIEGHIETSVIAQLDFVHSSDLINYLRMEYLNISYNIHLVNRLEHLNDAVDLTNPRNCNYCFMSVANDSVSPNHSLHTLSKSSLM